MALKNRIDQLIRDEWNKPEIAQLTIWDALSTTPEKNVSCVTPNTATPETTHETTHETTQWVQEYHVTAKGEKYKYYRYCYLESPGDIGSCVRVHLPGGNIHSTKAIALKEKVDTAIAQGLSPSAIVLIIKSSTRSNTRR